MLFRPVLQLASYQLVVCICLCSGPIALATDGFQVFPKSIELTGQAASSLVLVQYSNGEVVGAAPTADKLSLEIADASIASIESGRVVAHSDGQTELIVRLNDFANEVRVPISVAGSGQPKRWEFDAHVQSILARQSCNSGGCHGALSGKGGFRLSLQGYDSLQDHFTMTRQDRGRRVEPSDPGRSLLLAKPTMAIPHKGGQRLEVGSDDYRVLAEWISGGYQGPQESDAALEEIEVLPQALRLSPGSQQQMLVRARYADGRIEDVTHWAKFSSANEVVATVDETGQVKVLGSGKGTIVVWFASRIATSGLVVPHQARVAEAAYEDFQPANQIDTILLEEWKSLGLIPSATCSDAAYLRRAYLDTTGRLPTPETVREFVASQDPQKRVKLVDVLLASESYVDYWSYQWSDLLLVNGTLLRPDAVAAFYQWIRQQVQTNTPWDAFTRQIVLARGESTLQGATNFYAIHQSPEDLTENTCQAFMGLSIGCAKCHNHPLEKWTNDQYYAMANLYSRVRAKGWGGDSRNGDGHRTLVVLNRGDLIQPSRREPQPPAPLDAPAIDINSPVDRRIVLADWLTSPDNKYFSRSIVNRVWANYMGVGLVESVDDLRASNPASSERLLDALADYLVQEHYDLKSLMRLILNSQAYARSSQAVAGNEDDSRFYCRYYPRRLMAEVLHDAIVTVTQVPTEFTKIEFPGADTRDTTFYSEGTRSIELYDSAVANYFLKTFGRHQRRITCVCERSDQPTVVQALHLNNGDTINEKLANPNSVVESWIAENTPVDQAIEQAYLAALSRFPTESESQRLMALIDPADASQTARRETLEDLLWSLMTSKEFLFSH